MLILQMHTHFSDIFFLRLKAAIDVIRPIIWDACPIVKKNSSQWIVFAGLLLDLVLLILINLLLAKLSLFFHLFEFVSRYRDPQLQVGENYS